MENNASELHAHVKSFKGKDLAHFMVTVPRRPGLRSSTRVLATTGASEPSACTSSPFSWGSTCEGCWDVACCTARVAHGPLHSSCGTCQ